MGRFKDAFEKAYRSEIGLMGQPSFEEAPVTSMANRSNILAQLKALRMPPERQARIDAYLEKFPAKQELAYTIKDAEGVRAKTGAILGTIAADIASDGMRNIWWFINAPQALTQVATQQAIASGGGATRSPLIENRATRMAATLPAVIGISLGVGQFGREPGFKASVPSEEDPTQTADPVMEGLNRYFLGRSGGLLPYEEFVQERPDVSREEYNAYKNYLFTNKNFIKATDEGVLGPEVTFMGKSIPLITAALPAAAGVIGAGYGARRAAAKNRDLLAQRGMSPTDRKNVDKESLQSILKYGGGATAGAALATQVLESIRRQMGSGEAE